MASLDFPNTPTVGQVYIGPYNVSWTWNGTQWVASTTAGSFAPITNPVFTGNPQAPTPPPGDSDTSLATTAFVQAAVAPLTHNVGRNLIHNPLMNITQRGLGPFTAGYTADRWRPSVVSDTVSYNVYPMDDGGRAQIGDEAATWLLQNAFTGNAAATAQNYLIQPMERVRRLAGKTVTASFWANAASAIKLGVNLSQVFGTGGSPSAGLWGGGQSVTVGTTFARYSLTFTLPSVAGKTLGTNNDDYTGLAFFYSAGANANANAGGIGVQSGTVNIWGIQLEIGAVASPLEKPDPADDLARCQRFYETGYFYISGSGSVANAGCAYVQPFAVPKRATPVMTFQSSSLTNMNGNALGATMSGFNVFGQNTAVGGYVWSGSFTANADI